MKYLSKILPLTLTLLMAFAQVQAQQNVDNNRLNRDINIMENILSELFQVKSSSSSQRSRGVVTAFASRSEEVRGTYLPGYGVIFQISKPSANILIASSDEDEEEEHTVVFQYGDAEGEEEVNAESVKNRIVEFLKDYGSTIGQLSEDNHVMVIYGGAATSRSGINFFAFTGNRMQGNSDPDLPVISVSAQMSDLTAYRSGDLSDQQFQNRVAISETEPNDTGSKDLRVMANIFETAFEDNEEGFEVRGSVDYLQLDNFGALFFFEARYGTSRAIFEIPNIQIRGSDNNNLRVRAIEETRQALEEQQKAAEQKREELRKNATTAFETFKTELKEYLVDYGRTLGSVDSDQHILVSINLNASVDEIPDRIDVQITKSVLDQMDRGDISREQAISRVSIREY